MATSPFKRKSPDNEQTSKSDLEGETAPHIMIILQEEKRALETVYVIPLSQIKDQLMDMISQMTRGDYKYDDGSEDDKGLKEKAIMKERIRQEKEENILEAYFLKSLDETYKAYRIKQVESSFIERVQQNIVQVALIQLDDFQK